MIRALAVAFLVVFGATAQAQELPDRYRVVGVANGDTLNIRAEPTAASDSVGAFAPTTRHVEILRTQDGWGYVGGGETAGWVSMAFLAPNPPAANEVPRPMACFGTEPFWSLTFDQGSTKYNDPDIGPRFLTVLREQVAPNGFLIEARAGQTITRTIAITALPCSDGMSDRNFGMSMTMFTESAGGNSVQTGCCTMQVN